MATLAKPELESALRRLGELAAAEGKTVDLLLFGGSVMVLAFGARLSTRDVDAVVRAPPDRARVRGWAEVVAAERGWPPDWLNDGVKGYVGATEPARTLLAAPGISVRLPPTEQLLAMKLCAWRDDIDVDDAGRLLRECPGDQGSVWARVARYLQPGRELKARHAFEDLWEGQARDTA